MALILLLLLPWIKHGNRLNFNLLRAEELQEKVKEQDQLKVERLGGFGGFGLPGSHLKSKGEVSISKLSPDDLQKINGLFKGDVPLGTAMPDGFRYRITRKIGDDLQTIEVPEENVPMPIRNCVKDTLE
jgi:hypothetical protein